ncbi:hypothetical protein CL614_00785 [archaeon]|nr:hypothetical protein [archaeon]
MATKRKSIIEEALLEAKSLEDALKANTKEILASHMKEEIETIVESSLKEQLEDEEIEIDAELEGSDEDIEEPADEEAGGDLEVAELDLDDEVGAEESELVNLDIDALSDEGGEDIDIDIAELPIDLDFGDGSEIDLTDQSDEEVLKVFKAMGDEDEVEVVRDEDGITLTDNETGAEYYIKESEELDEDDLCEGCGEDIYEIELDERVIGVDQPESGKKLSDYEKYEDGDLTEHQGYDDEEDESLGMRRGTERDYRQSYRDRREDSYGKWGKRGSENRGISLEEEDWGSDKDEYARRSSGGVKHRAGDVGGGKYGKGGHYKDYELDEGGDYKGDQSKTRSDYADYKDTDKGYHGKTGSSHGDQGEPDDYLDEDKLQRHQKNGYQRKSGAKVGSNQANPYGGRYSESRKPRKTISNRKKISKNQKQVANSTILKEYKELKTKNNEYKEALKLFKGKLNEVALFNTNLAYVNRLFTEHSTTKKEKMNILKRFDTAESIKESKNIYKSLKGELESQVPITESVENKVNKTVKSSASDLNESTAYVDPQIAAIKDLMKRIS